MMPGFKHNYAPLTIAMLTALATAGCATTQTIENQTKVTEQTNVLEALISPTTTNIHEGPAPLEILKLSEAQQLARERAWLRAKKVTYTPKNPVPANEVLKLFRQQGINITSALPLDNYIYNGNGVKEADGETAVQLILGQMGLDYDVDQKGQYITVVPMKSRTWTINLGNRTSQSSATSFDSICEIATSQTAQGGQQNAGSVSQHGNTPTMPGASMPAQTSSNAGVGVSGVQTKNHFWTSLEKELRERVKVLVPTNGPASAQSPVGQNATVVPSLGGAMLPQGMGSAAGSAPGANDLYTAQTLGQFAINPETGAVTVQAPSWMLKQIDNYMHDVLSMFNTSMTFEGTVVNVRASTDQTAGLDLMALAKFAGNYGLVMSNNILGGVTLGGFTGASTLPGAGAAIGVVSDNLKVFNAFLKTVGGTQILNRPIITVTSGVPADFGRLTPIYTNEQTQEIAAGNVNSNALATIRNNIIEHRYGSLLRIMPHYDPKTRRVRAQVSLLQRPLVGYQNLTLALLDAKGGIQNQLIRKPQIECSVTSTEAILDDGEMIVVGGQVENVSENSHAGVDGLMDVPGVQWLTSQRRNTGSSTTMYFALRVRLNNKAVY
jgi:type II secretory pathway component GspD/PulD (secretin)